MSVVTYITFQALLDLTSKFQGDFNALDFITIKLRSQFNLIFENSTFITDETKENISLHAENPYVKKLIKNAKIVPNKDLFNVIRNNHSDFFKGDRVQPQIFILPNFPDDLLRQSQRDSGCFFFKNLVDLERLNLVHSLHLSASEPVNWKEVSDFIGPHSCILIEDPYLLLNTHAIDNCIELLKKTIPKSIRTDYYVTIVSRSKRKGEFSDEKGLQKLKEGLIHKISHLFPKAICEILTCDSSDFHDRSIITNNAFIFCGSGVGLTGKDGRISKYSNWISCGILNPFKIGEKTEIGLVNLKLHLKRISYTFNILNVQSDNPIFKICY